MSGVLRALLICISVITLIIMMKRIRRSKLQIEYAIFWVIFLGILIVLAVFPQIVYFLANLIGIQSPVNMVFLVIIFILMLKCFFLTIEVSQLEYKTQELVQKIALQDFEKEKHAESDSVKDVQEDSGESSRK